MSKKGDDFMYLFFYILILTLIVRLMMTLLYTFPELALFIIVAIVAYSFYTKRQRGFNAWNSQSHAKRPYTQNESQFRTTAEKKSNPADVFEAEYTEYEVH